MRTFDFTNGKQFPETLHVRKSVPYPASFDRLYELFGLHYDLFYFWKGVFDTTVYNQNHGSYGAYPVLGDFIQYVMERVPIYFVNTNQIGQTIDVQETGYSIDATVVPDNHFEIPDIEEEYMGRIYASWNRAFRDRLERGEYSEEDRDRIRPEYPFNLEVFPDFYDTDFPMLVCEADGLYCPTGGDPDCKESNPEIFIYMDYFVDEEGNPTRPDLYMFYVIIHELTHAMMDERLWEAFLCKTGQKLAKNISHESTRYTLHEEGIATAVGWAMTGYNPAVAKEIMKKPLPYQFGLSSYFFEAVEYLDDNKLWRRRIPEWLTQKINDPTPYL